MPFVVPTQRPERPARSGGGGDDFGGYDGDGGGGDDSRDDPFPPRRWVTVATFWTPAEAHIARLKLESASVACVLLDEMTASTQCLAIAVGGIKLQVPAEDHGRAADLLGFGPPLPPPGGYDWPTIGRYPRRLDAAAAAAVAEGVRATCRVVAVDPPPEPFWHRVLKRLAPHARQARADAIVFELRVDADHATAARAAVADTPMRAGLVER